MVVFPYVSCEMPGHRVYLEDVYFVKYRALEQYTKCYFIPEKSLYVWVYWFQAAECS